MSFNFHDGAAEVQYFLAPRVENDFWVRFFLSTQCWNYFEQRKQRHMSIKHDF
jgi:hypothetical protein